MVQMCALPMIDTLLSSPTNGGHVNTHGIEGRPPNHDLREWMARADALGELRTLTGASWEEDTRLTAGAVIRLDDGPVFENVLTGDDIDVMKFRPPSGTRTTAGATSAPAASASPSVWRSAGSTSSPTGPWCRTGSR